MCDKTDAPSFESRVKLNRAVLLLSLPVDIYYYYCCLESTCNPDIGFHSAGAAQLRKFSQEIPLAETKNFIHTTCTMSSGGSSNPQETQHQREKGDGASGSGSGVRFGGGDLCLKCQSRTITYECDPCGHASFCTDCARKLASGGKCKICGEMYGGLRRVHQPQA